ncbi:MAG: cell division protein FtsZ, partial [Acidobacteriota bacterium]|nr:cell division protein FtsZ [Acidobacteriota bacterium]
GMGRAMMGTGTASGKDRAAEAANRAIASPLLEDISIQGAKGILINITGSEELLLHEVSESASIIHEAADEDANIIFGAVIDNKMTDHMKITVIATGFDSNGAESTMQPSVGDSVETEDSYSLSSNPAATAPEAVTVPESGVPPGQGRPYDPRDFEVPAYLRRKFDD